MSDQYAQGTPRKIIVLVPIPDERNTLATVIEKRATQRIQADQIDKAARIANMQQGARTDLTENSVMLSQPDAAKNPKRLHRQRAVCKNRYRTCRA